MHVVCSLSAAEGCLQRYLLSSLYKLIDSIVMVKHDMCQIKTNSLLVKKLMINNEQLILTYVSGL